MNAARAKTGVGFRFAKRLIGRNDIGTANLKLPQHMPLVPANRLSIFAKRQAHRPMPPGTPQSVSRPRIAMLLDVENPS